MEVKEIPVWPAHQGSGSPRQMNFLFAEARWYLWVQEENKQAISATRRDLLLLHQNGDLELVKDLNVGMFVTALYDNKMIRARIIRPLDAKDELHTTEKRLKSVTLIDVDEGRILTVKISQVRKIPPDFMTLPCQAIRCDIGLDCSEQFNWPSQLNNMLHKALENALLLVEYTNMRPGSIPTILAKINILNPATGQTMPMQKWLIEVFSAHLKLCSFDEYKPFPVGMTSDLVEKSVGGQPQQVFGFVPPRPSESFPHVRSRLGPHTGPALPGPGHIETAVVGMPIPVRSFPATVPGMFPGAPAVQSIPLPMPYGLQSPMAAGFQPSFPPNMAPRGGFGSMPGYNPGFQHGFVPPLSFPGRSPANLPPNQVFVAPRPVPIPTAAHPNRTVSQSTSSISLIVKQPLKNGMQDTDSSMSPVSSVVFESDIDPKTMLLSSSSSLTSNSEMGMKKQSGSAFSNNLESPPNAMSCGPGSNKGKSKIDEKTTPSKGLNADALPFIGVSRQETKNKVNVLVDTDKSKNVTINSSSNLSVDAPPFDRACWKKKTNSNTDVSSSIAEDSSSNSSSLSVDAPAFVPKLNSTSQKQSSATDTLQNKLNPKIVKDLQAPSTLCSNYVQPKERISFKTGKEVDLDIIDPEWRVGDVLSAVVAKVVNPSCLEFNVVSQQTCHLAELQEEISNYYRSNKKKIVSKQQAQDLCGNYCACYDPDEKFWFRAHIDNWFMDDSVTPLQVWAVDIGGSSQVDISHIQPLVTELACSLPCLVTLCSMKNIQPRSKDGIWPEVHLERLKMLLPESKQVYLRVDGPMSMEYKWPVSIYFNAECSMQSVNETLVSEGCASYVPMCSKSPVDQYDNAEDPMEEAFRIGGNNYDIDDEDACVAVTGRKIDESGICWFYNNHGYCYKKFCTLKHVRLDPDGHSIEKAETITQPFESINDGFLAPGNCIKLTVTKILTVNHFIARVHLKKGTLGIQSRETLSSVIEHLNSTKMKRSLKTFTVFPADGEIVLFKDETGKYYRGRNLGSDPSDENLFEVLNVDSGHVRKVSIQNLRVVDPAFLHHPFEAVECWLADVAPTSNDPEWVKTCNTLFAELVKDKRMSATIIRSSAWGIEVNMSDKEGQDIAVVLMDMGLLVKNPMRHLPKSDSLYLPG